MDVYSYSTNMKRARGDVDPEARASFNDGKGKQRQAQDSEDELISEDDLVIGADGFVEFTGVKPKGLKMGMSDDEDEGGRGWGDDDEEIDSDEAEEDIEDLPANTKKVSNNFIIHDLHLARSTLDKDQFGLRTGAEPEWRLCEARPPNLPEEDRANLSSNPLHSHPRSLPNLQSRSRSTLTRMRLTTTTRTARDSWT